MKKSFLDFIIFILDPLLFILVSIFWIWISCDTFLFSKPSYLTHTENNPNFYIDSTGRGTKYLKLDNGKYSILCDRTVNEIRESICDAEIEKIEHVTLVIAYYQENDGRKIISSSHLKKLSYQDKNKILRDFTVSDRIVELNKQYSLFYNKYLIFFMMIITYTPIITMLFHVDKKFNITALVCLGSIMILLYLFPSLN